MYWTVDEEMVSAIMEYIEDLKEPTINTPHYCFKELSYSRWAANEVLIYVIAHNELTPIQAVETFREMMDSYSTKVKGCDYNHELIFSIAYDVATDILDLLLAMV